MKNDKKLKTAIFGGSFDPLHFGHIDIVANLEKIFDKVIVVPSYISPFKTDVGNGKARLALCKKAFASDKTEVSRFEVNKKSVSYSVDTAKYYAKKTGGDLFWVIGSEELTRLADWHDIDTLKTLVTFYVVPRPGYEPTESTLKALKKRKIKIKLARFVGLDISSVGIKLDLAFGYTNKFMPAYVHDYAVKHDLFNPYKQYVAALYAHGLKQGRIEHTYRTAVRGAELAKLYGASVSDAVIACLLHDIGKSEDADKYEDKLDLSDYPPPTKHSPIGAYIAKHEFGVSDEIARAIEVHSTADDNMTTLDEIVYLADKTESGRDYKEVYKLRKLCAWNVNYAMLYALIKITDYNRVVKDSQPTQSTLRAIEHYKALCGGTEIPDPPERAEVKQTKPRTAKKIAVSAAKSVKRTGDEAYDIAVAVADELNLHKARDIDIVGLDGKTIIADYFVIASCSSTTAVKALMGYAEDRLTKQFGLDPIKRDVDREWVALDYGAVIIHIFTDKTREFYNIERLWSGKGENNIERYGD